MKIHIFLFAFILSMIVYADLESIAPGGVAYDVFLKEEKTSVYYFQFYGSQVVNCKRKNDTQSPLVSFGVSDHTGVKYNVMYTFKKCQYKNKNMGSWGDMPVDNQTVSNYDKTILLYKDNLNNTSYQGSNLIRFVVTRNNISCVNQKQFVDQDEYWMHSYLMAGPNSLGGDPNDPNDTSEDKYIYYFYDGNIHEMPEIEVETEEISQNLATITVKVYPDGQFASSYLNGLSQENLFFHCNVLSSSDESLQLPISANYGLTNFVDVTENGETYCKCTINVNPLPEGFNTSRYVAYLSGYARLNYMDVPITSNTEYFTVGYDPFQQDVLGFLDIQARVTSNGTINAYLFRVYRSVNAWKYELVKSPNIVWECSKGQFTGSSLVFNPYNGNSDRDVSRIQTIKATIADAEGGVNSAVKTIELPKLNESKPLDQKVQEDNDIPPEEERQPDVNQNVSSDTDLKRNELLDDILNEIRNSRDESLNYYKEMMETFDINGTHQMQGASVESLDGNLSGFQTTINDGLGSLGASGGYGDALGEGFGKGVGEKIDLFRNLTSHDLSITIDLRSLNSLVPRVDTSGWVWTFGLYPDTSTEWGQRLNNTVIHYIRPCMLFFIWFILGVTCVKDITSFFGNGCQG